MHEGPPPPPRPADPRLTALARHDLGLARLLQIALDDAVAEPERRRAARLLDAFLVLTPTEREGWRQEHDPFHQALFWRRAAQP